MNPGTEQGRSPRVLARPEHCVSRADISANALKVLTRIERAGFVAYLVGGAVRDLLTGRTPKDFDVGTNARPQQVRQLFRNARIIGRRFRLVLVTFADEIIEVATFRRSPEAPDEDATDAADALAPVAEAEEYGTPEEDAWRRDFTVNGLFYNIADFSVIDHVRGLDDLAKGVIRSIGPARQRFVEDPVRMMRAIEYAARLGFELDAETADAVQELQSEVRRAAPARIAYELLESLKSRHARAIFEGLADTGLLSQVLPEVGARVPVADGITLFTLLDAVDQSAERGTAISDEARLALIFLPAFLAVLENGGPTRGPDLERAIREIVDPPALRLAFSHYRAHLLRTGFFLLARLVVDPRSPSQVVRTCRHEGFPLARELARLLDTLTGRYRPALERWEQATLRAEAGLPALAEKATVAPAPSRRRRRRGGRRRGAGAARPSGGESGAGS